ncbi:MAG: sulfatase-like hydrolase/transferase [Planctomycetota bacterium]|nr:sulfatase-like hydrolase/transferase [Planctomycetota bacterium]MDA1163470.1 sulfatase-like hydrolase/transferase [Planctomycetota bacterium]
MDDQQLDPMERGSRFYSTTAIVDDAVRCLTDHAKQHGDKPFFHDLAFSAPHFPLHALPEVNFELARNR